MVHDLERRVRGGDPDSAWEAAMSVADFDVADLEGWVGSYARTYGPVTDDQIVRAYRRSGGKLTPQRVRTAREALVHPKRGWPTLAAHPVDGLSDLGNRARRWVAI